MVFVQNAFICILRLLVIQLTVLFLLTSVGHSIDLQAERHSITLLFLNHSIGLSFGVHSIVSQPCSSSILPTKMTVTTRSMTKRLLSLNTPGSLLENTVSLENCTPHDLVVTSSSLDRGSILSSSIQNLKL